MELLRKKRENEGEEEKRIHVTRIVIPKELKLSAVEENKQIIGQQCPISASG